MDEPKAPSKPPTGRFMDIARPQTGEDAVTQPPQPVVAPQPATPPAPSVKPEVTSAPEVVEAPVAPVEALVAQPVPEPKLELPPASVTPAPSQEPKVAEEAKEESASTQAEGSKPSNEPAPVATQETEPNQVEHPQLPPKTHKAPLIAIFVAMAICLTLTGLVIFTYIKSKNDTKISNTSSSNSKTTVEKPQASPDDIDQTSNDIDQTLSSIDDAADFSTAALSDQSLGL